MRFTEAEAEAMWRLLDAAYSAILFERDLRQTYIVLPSKLTRQIQEFVESHDAAQSEKLDIMQQRAKALLN
jgi:hypothetical protein